MTETHSQPQATTKRPDTTDKCLNALLSSNEGLNLYRTVDNELFLALGDVSRSLLIASAVSGEGRSSLALLLACQAAAYASEGPVLLIEATLSKGSLERKLGSTAAECGFNQFNVEGGDWRPMVRKSIQPNLDILPAGAFEWRNAKLSQGNFSRLIQEAKAHYRWVVVDSPPGGVNLDVVSMASLADAVLMVIRYGGATREQIAPLVERLKETDTRMLGAVLNQRIYPVPKLFYGAASY